MRKLLLVLCFCLCAVGVWAYEAGDVSVGLAAVYSPLGLGSDFGEINVDDQNLGISHDAKLGQPGLGGEIQALYFVNPRIGVGMSFEDQYFAKDLSSGWGLDTRTRMRNYMAVGHIFLTPQNKYQLYIPVGIGLAQTDFSMDFSPRGDSKKHFNYTGFAYYAGLGIEKTLHERLQLGVEARYNVNRFHDSATRDNGDHVTVYERANFFSVLIRLIYKL